MAQAAGRPKALRRKPDPTALHVVVPDAAKVKPFTPSVDYAWQNPVVRKKLFPWRESKLRSFLLDEMKNDLEAELKGSGYTAAMAADIGEKILAERKRLTEEMAEHTRLRKQAEADLRTAQAATRKHLAEPEVREQDRKKRALEEQHKRLAKSADAQRARIAELEKKGGGIGAGEQRELDKRRGMLDDINAELEPTAQSLGEITSEFETGLEPFSSAEAQLKEEIKEHKTKEATLRPQLERVSGGVDSKKKASREAAVKWRLHESEARISGLGHDELIGLILDEFAADKDQKRFSPQKRYELLHFSGLHYSTAHGTWGPPQELLATLKEQEIREMFPDLDPDADFVEEQAEATGTAIETELNQIDAELKSKDISGAVTKAEIHRAEIRRAELLAVKKGLDTPDTVRARLFAKKPEEEDAFKDLQANIRWRAEAMARGEAGDAEEFTQRIEELERQIGAPDLKRIHDADHKRLVTLRDFRVREAREAMNSLNDLDALSVLQDMKDAFPPWVWHEVVRRTQLRVNVTDPNWDDPTPAKSLDPKDPVTARWLAILKGWPREESAWESKHSEELEIVATAVVCNQLAEHVQHLYGKQTPQGIRNTVNWYRAKAAEAKVKGTTGAQAPFLIRPTTEQDFVEGSSLFWAHFESKQPYKGNMAHQLEGIDFLTEGKQVMHDGLVEGDWTYHVYKATGNITRTKGPAGRG